MYKNYIITAMRSLLNNKMYSLLNIGGLAIGLAACIMIFLFVRDELSYDKHIPNVEQMYRLEGAFRGGDGNWVSMALSPGRLPKALVKDYAEIEAITRFYQEGYVIKKGNEIFIDNIWFADPDVFKVFDIEMVSGNREDIFKDNTSIILDEDMAKKYFGDQNPIGEILELDEEDYSFKVVGVMKNLPQNTHLDFQFLTMLDESRYVDRPWVAINWMSSNTFTYMKLASQKTAEFINADLPSFLNRNVPTKNSNGTDRTVAPSEGLWLNLIPVLDIHLYSGGRFQMKPGGDIIIVYSFSIIAVLILVIACINFINLSTARASMRAREIAVRKVAGATRTQLISQFLGETGLTVLIALILAVGIVTLALPFFGDFVAKLLSLNITSDPLIQLGFLGLLVVVGVGAGLQPAFLISSFRPSEVLKSNKSSANDNGWLRTALVTFQFAISIGLISATLIVYGQTQYAKNLDFGFETKNRLIITNMTYPSIKPVAKTIRQEIANLPGVLGTTMTDRTVPINGFWSGPVELMGSDEKRTVALEPFRGDFDTLKFMNARLLAGRLFSEDFQGDLRKPIEGTENGREDKIIINVQSLRAMGFKTPEDAIGKSIQYIGYGGGLNKHTIVGVIQDMYLRSLREGVQSMIFQVRDQDFQVLNVNIDPNRQEETLLQIDKIWETHVPSFPIRRSFIEERFERLYEADAQRGEMFGYFAIFAVLVSCLGLFGLASFTADRKTGEIGVRKVMGASIFDIIQLLLWQFSKPVLVANIIAWPVVWYFMSNWLEGFAYRIDLTPLPFVLAGGFALLIAWGTVAFHAWRVARTNPITALRYE